MAKMILQGSKMIKIPFYRRLSFRILVLLIFVLFTASLAALLGARYAVEQDFRELLSRQFRLAGNMVENSFKQIGQMALNGANRFLLHPELRDAINEGDSPAIAKIMKVLVKEHSADITILLDAGGTVLYHSENPGQIGKSRISQN
ncbi:MAG: hypothetical protein KAJ95_04320, partial [Gammaproteobacteria bacterium]|nr:hypothetical protein [Gammaproteobacteria bacterium]